MLDRHLTTEVDNFTKHENVLIAVEEALQLLRDVTSGVHYFCTKLARILAMLKVYLLGLINHFIWNETLTLVCCSKKHLPKINNT